jgi:hypothetical protein
MISCISRSSRESTSNTSPYIDLRSRKSSKTEQRQNTTTRPTTTAITGTQSSYPTRLRSSITLVVPSSSLRLSLVQGQASGATSNKELIGPRSPAAVSPIFGLRNGDKDNNRRQRVSSQSPNFEFGAHNQSIRKLETKVWLFHSTLFQSRPRACVSQLTHLFQGMSFCLSVGRSYYSIDAHSPQYQLFSHNFPQNFMSIHESPL